MPRIPTLQDRFIPDIQTKPSEVGAVGSAINFAMTAAQVGNRFKIARDTTMVNESHARFQAELISDFDTFKRENKDSASFAKNWNTFYNEKKKSYIDDPNLSRAAKRNLTTILDQDQLRSDVQAQRTQRALEVDEYAMNVERAAIDNNLLAYRGGENLDLSVLKQNEKIIQGNIIAGSTLVDKDKLQESQIKQTQNVYANFIKGAAGTDVEFATRLIENDEIQDKLASVELIDQLRGYIKRIKDGESALDIEVQTTLQSEFDAFNIGLKKGKDVIKNKELNNVDSLIAYRDSVRDAYAKNYIKDDQYKNWMAKTTSAFTTMIREDKLPIGIKAKIPFYTSVNEQLTDDIQAQFKDNPDIEDSEFVGIYEDTIKQLEEEEIGLKSTETEDKLRAQKLFKGNTEKYLQLKKSRDDARSVVIGNRVMPLNSKSTTTGKKLDTGGFMTQIVTVGNRKFKVETDQNGIVVSQEEIR